MSKNQTLATKLVELVGGKENVVNVFHCMTRLRFDLKDNSLAQLDEIKKTEGVSGVHINVDEIQVIIGPAVDDVYKETIKLVDIKETAKIEENLDEKKEKFSFKSIGNAIVKAFSSCMMPLVPLFIVVGMLNVVMAVIGPNFLNIVASDSALYNNFYITSQAILYFLPILVAVTGSKFFKTNIYISLGLAFVLVYPDLVSIFAEGNWTVYGITATATTYSATILPMMFILWAQHYVELGINKICPDVVKVVLVPFLTTLVMLPLSLCALGPLGTFLSNGLATVIMTLYEVAGPVEAMVVGALCNFMTAFGLGTPLFFVCMMNLFAVGVDYAFMPIALCLSNWVAMGIALGYAIKQKNAEDRQLGITCFAANFLGGVSEPTLFSILVPNKRAWLAAIIGGGLGGLCLGIFKVGVYQFGTSNFLNVLTFLNAENPSNLIFGIISAVVGFLAAMIAMIVLFKKEEATK